MDRIAFKLPDDGLREVDGFLYLDDEFLVIDLHTAFLGFADKERQTIKVDPAALEDVYLKRGLVRDRICVQPKRPDLLDAVPGKHDYELRLKTKRADRRRAERLVSTLAFRIQTAA